MLDENAQKDVDEFVKYVEHYCQLIENRDSVSTGEFIKKAAVLLPALYMGAAKLPMLWTDSDDLIDDYVTTDMAAKVSRDIDGKLGKYSSYWQVFEPYEEEGEASRGMLFDDFADIYRDLKDALETYKKGTEKDREEALWAWKFGFEHHWGDHITFALPAVHWLFVEKPFKE
ncbi:MAG: DUF5063 domain-containing protein [Planctomycetota bacterium]|nr:MAG: DUF5063 domain-containing protein [Planctomycetota bacterium]